MLDALVEGSRMGKGHEKMAGIGVGRGRLGWGWFVMVGIGHGDEAGQGPFLLQI